MSGTYEPSEMEHFFGVSAHSSGEGENLPAEEAVVVPAGLDEAADREAPQLFRPVSPDLPWELDSVRAIFGDLGRHLSPELPSLAGAWGLVGGANDVAPTIPEETKASAPQSRLGGSYLVALRNRPGVSLQAKRTIAGR